MAERQLKAAVRGFPRRRGRGHAPRLRVRPHSDRVRRTIGRHQTELHKTGDSSETGDVTDARIVFDRTPEPVDF
jgi:hypothetical protein